MSANVRCAGNGDPRRSIKVPAPCGWRGERFAIADIPAAELAGLKTTEERTIAIRHADAKVRTAKPCPRCGGRIELIPQEVEP